MCDRDAQGTAMTVAEVFAREQNTRAAVWWTGEHWSVSSVAAPTWITRKGLLSVRMSTRRVYRNYAEAGTDQLVELLAGVSA